MNEIVQTPAQGSSAALLADIGGTNARFALLDRNGQGPITYFPVAGYENFHDAMAAFLNGRTVGHAAIAVAGPVRNGRVELTNSPWVVDERQLKERFGIPQIRVANDFEALAQAIPMLTAEDLQPLGGGGGAAVGRLGEPIAVLGPGTGLGVACLVPTQQGFTVLDSEGGHVTAPSWNERTDAIIGYLRGVYGHVSAERLVSGQGMENLFRAVVAVDGLQEPQRDAVQITQGAVDGSCPTSVMVIDLFCAMLGEVAGNYALSVGARGGVYIAGGIAPRIIPQLKASQFRARFIAKGRFESYLMAIPTFLITHADATFLGLQAIVKAQSESDLSSATIAQVVR